MFLQLRYIGISEERAQAAPSLSCRYRRSMHAKAVEYGGGKLGKDKGSVWGLYLGELRIHMPFSRDTLLSQTKCEEIYLDNVPQASTPSSLSSVGLRILHQSITVLRGFRCGLRQGLEPRT